jgi:hypothetical protein
VNDLEDKTSASKGGITGFKKAADDGDETEEDDQEDTEEQTLIRRAEEIQRKLDNIVLENEDLARFVERCKFSNQQSYGSDISIR